MKNKYLEKLKNKVLFPNKSSNYVQSYSVRVEILGNPYNIDHNFFEVNSRDVLVDNVPLEEILYDLPYNEEEIEVHDEIYTRRDINCLEYQIKDLEKKIGNLKFRNEIEKQEFERKKEDIKNKCEFELELGIKKLENKLSNCPRCGTLNVAESFIVNCVKCENSYESLYEEEK